MGSNHPWGCTGAGMTRDKSNGGGRVKGCNGLRRGTTAALPPPRTCPSSRGPGCDAKTRRHIIATPTVAWQTSATAQSEGSMWHLAECVIVCYVYAGASARECAALRWVPARARERTPLTHSLSTRPRRSPQRHHAHSSPTSRARRRRAPRTEHGASARLLGASRRRELQQRGERGAAPGLPLALYKSNRG